MASFIGIDALTHIADQYESQIIMGAAYYRPEEMTRLGIKIISGLQFKNTKTLLVRKGGTTRKKVVGTELNSKIGLLTERVLVAKLTWNHFRDNRDNYVETPYQVEGSADFSYPMSEAAFLAVTATYGEDLFANLFFGDMTEGDEGMDLYDGFHTLISADINAGIISEANGNLQHCETIDAPEDYTDISAWTAVEEWMLKWNGNLKNQKEVLVYMSVKTGVNIKNAYANKWHGNSKVNTQPDGNFKVDEYPNVTFVPSDIFGDGDQLIATTPGNFEYGVNSEDSKSKITVREGSDQDNEDIFFQVQSIQGCRVLNPLASNFCMSDGTIAAVTVQGDYKTSNFIATVNDATMGSVKATSASTPDASGDYPVGATVSLTATANTGYKFVKWADGTTTATRSISVTGMPATYVAVFEANS